MGKSCRRKELIMEEMEREKKITKESEKREKKNRTIKE